MTPTSRTLKLLREQGYAAEVVERWNAFAKIRNDLFGIIDIVAIKAGEPGVFAVQTTSQAHVKDRMEKARQNSLLPVWLGAGNRFEVWGWAKRGPRGKRKEWQVSRSVLT